ncbi:MAG TPA: SdrD B-like domain-containing protein, partial [Coriobacteriia bacterium]|nr:SdrD B-like domain-containing protein [Coriobacteriia bacterium]
MSVRTVVRGLRPAAARRTSALGIAVLIAIAVLGTQVMTANAADPEDYSYFPSASTTDGRFLSIAGSGLSAFFDNHVTLSFAIDGSKSQFDLGFFDGDDMSATWDWNTTTALPMTFTVYADPAGDGSGSTVVWTSTQDNMTQDSWQDFTIATSEAARSAGGDFFYRVRIGTTSVNSTVNNFKMRVEGTTYITPLSTFSYMGIATGSTYDQSWDFWMVVPQGANYLQLWDGDLDLAADTDDPNTPATPPAWAPNAVNEGANAGAPADDVTYELVGPDASRYYNGNPSGNQEWEIFRLDKATFDGSVMDYHVDEIPSGVWVLDVASVNARNLNAFYFEHPVVGVDFTGRPIVPVFPYALGDRVWLDDDRDGAIDAGEADLTGAVLTLRDNLGSFLSTTTVEPGGTYRFTVLPGTYTVDINDPANYVSAGPLAGLEPTTPRSVTVVITDDNDYDLDFGLAPGPALVVEKSLAPAQPTHVTHGDDVLYGVTVTNVGETTATAVSVSDTFDASAFEYVGSSSDAVFSSGVSTSDPTTTTASDLLWDFGGTAEIAPGDALTLTYRLRVTDDAAPGSYVNSASATAESAYGLDVARDSSTWIAADTDPDDADDASVWVSVPELSVTKTLTSLDTTIQAGQTADFAIVVRNTGDTRIDSIQLTDSFEPGQLAYASASPAPSAIVAGTLYWAEIGPLDPNEQAIITVAFTAVGTDPDGSTVNVAATGATTDEFGLSVPAASGTASVAITRPSLSVTKSVTSGSTLVNPGDPVEFSIVVANDGDTAIGSVSLSDLFHEALIYQDASELPNVSAVTTNAVSASVLSGGWSNSTNSLGAPDGVSATSGAAPFEMRQQFSAPSGIVSITDASLTVRSRASGWAATAPPVYAGVSKYPTANPTMVRGSIDAGDYTALAVSDNTRLTLREHNPGARNLAADFDSNQPFTEATAPDVTSIVVTGEGYLEAGTEAVYVRFWDFSTGNWSTVWYQLGSSVWTTTEASYTATVSNVTEIQDYIDGSGNFRMQFADNDYRVGTNDGTRTRVYIDVLGATFNYLQAPGYTNDDTWSVQYSIDGGSSWSDIAAASVINEGALTDHSVDLTGILTASNIDDLRVRVLGETVGGSDGAGTVEWDASTLDLTYSDASAGSTSLSWSNLGPLAPGEQTTVSVSFLVAPDADGALVNTATVEPAVDEYGDPVAADVSSAAVYVDAIAPVTSDDAPLGWQTTAPSVTLSVIETGTPPATTYYSLAGGALEVYTEPLIVSVEGTTTLEYYSVDAAGNIESTKSATILLDTSDPYTTAGGVPSSATSETVTVTLTGADDVSGLSAVYYRVNSGPVSVYSDPLLFDADGVYVLEYWAEDVAGNVETANQVTFTIDTTAPVVEVTGVTDGGLYDAPVTPVVTISGATSETVTLNGAPYVSGTEVSADGTYTL